MAGVPPGPAATRRAGCPHHGDPDLHPQLERVHRRAVHDQRPDIQTATVAISKFTGATEFQAPFDEQMAAGVIVTVPLVIMVLIFQRRIVEGFTAGASK